MAIETCQSTDGLREFLTARNGQILPETVDGLLRTIDGKTNQIKLAGNVVLIESDSEDIADRNYREPECCENLYRQSAVQLERTSQSRTQQIKRVPRKRQVTRQSAAVLPLEYSLTGNPGRPPPDSESGRSDQSNTLSAVDLHPNRCMHSDLHPA